MEGKCTYMQRIQREYETQKGLDHHNIARMYSRVDMNDRWVFALTL